MCVCVCLSVCSANQSPSLCLSVCVSVSVTVCLSLCVCVCLCLLLCNTFCLPVFVRCVCFACEVDAVAPGPLQACLFLCRLSVNARCDQCHRYSECSGLVLSFRHSVSISVCFQEFAVPFSMCRSLFISKSLNQSQCVSKS